MLGQEHIEEIIASTDVNLVDINTATQSVIGDKSFLLKNHLGNQSRLELCGTLGVHHVVTDRKIPEEENGDIAYFYPDIVSHSDYLPFGMKIEARSSSTSEVDFGFNEWPTGIEEMI